jgi:hypothetical protein
VLISAARHPPKHTHELGRFTKLLHMDLQNFRGFDICICNAVCQHDCRT